MFFILFSSGPMPSIKMWMSDGKFFATSTSVSIPFSGDSLPANITCFLYLLSSPDGSDLISIALGLILSGWWIYSETQAAKAFESEEIVGIITNLYTRADGSKYTESEYMVVLDRKTTHQISEDTFVKLEVGDVVMLNSTYFGVWNLMGRVSIG